MRTGIVTLLAGCCLLFAAQPAAACGWEPFCNGFTPEEVVEFAQDQPVPGPDNTTVRRFALVAYGTGTTSCTVTVDRSPATSYSSTFSGNTTCSAVVLQTGQAWMTGSRTLTGPLCSGVRTSCWSGGGGDGTFDDVHYRVTLVAPLGQGWVAPPAECSGAGTDRLECTF